MSDASGGESGGTLKVVLEEVEKRLAQAQGALAEQHKQVLVLLSESRANERPATKTSSVPRSHTPGDSQCLLSPDGSWSTAPRPKKVLDPPAPLEQAPDLGTVAVATNSINSINSEQHPIPGQCHIHFEEGSSLPVSAMTSAATENRQTSSQLRHHWEVRENWSVKKPPTKQPLVKLKTFMARSSFGGHRLDVSDGASSEESSSSGLVACFILRPNKYPRATWDVCTMILILYDLVFIPFSFFDPEPTPFLEGLAWFSLTFWSCDMGVSFLSGYITSSGCIEMRLSKIARRYLKTWFLVDVVVVGIDWLDLYLRTVSNTGTEGARMAKASRAFRILRMLRLLRLAKANGIVSFIAEKLASEEIMILVDVFRLGVIMLATGHFFACLWYAIGKDGPANDNWLEIFGFAGEDLMLRYIMSMRWALSQYSGGMDEVVPQNFTEHIYSAVVWLLAWWSGIGIVAIVTAHVTRAHAIANLESQKINQLHAYLRQRGISKALCMRIVRNAQYSFMMQKAHAMESSMGITEVVSLPLLTEMHFEMYYPGLSPIPFFNRSVTNNAHVVRKICHGAMATSFAALGDQIFNEGQVAEHVVINSHGKVTYTWNAIDEEELGAGTYFSEATLWTQWVHQGTLVAQENSRLLNLCEASFGKIMSQFEMEAFDPAAYAQTFVKILNDLATEDVTDLPMEIEEEDDGHLEILKRLIPSKTLDHIRESVALTAFGKTPTFTRRTRKVPSHRSAGGSQSSRSAALGKQEKPNCLLVIPEDQHDSEEGHGSEELQ